MMNIPPSEARELSWWEYQAVLSTWSARHSTEDDDDAEAPDANFVARRFAQLEKSGLVTGSVH